MWLNGILIQLAGMSLCLQPCDPVNNTATACGVSKRWSVHGDERKKKAHVIAIQNYITLRACDKQVGPQWGPGAKHW